MLPGLLATGGLVFSFEHATVAQLPECGEEIAFPFVDKEAPAQAKKIEIEIG